MMKNVKHTFSTIGDRSSELARTFGSETADLAKRFGSGTAGLAKRIGPKRGLIGLAVLAAAVGGAVVLIRYLRARSAENAARAEAAGGEGAAAGRDERSRNRSRAQRSTDVPSAY